MYILVVYIVHVLVVYTSSIYSARPRVYIVYIHILVYIVYILVVYRVHVLVVYTSSKKYSTRPRHARNASPELCPPLYCSKRQANTAKETYVRVTRQKRPMRVAQRPIMSGVRRPSRA